MALVRDDAEMERLNPGSGRGLVWLVGRDGNDATDQCPSERDSQRRMLERRQQPVGIPPADHAPSDALSPYTDGTERRL